MGQTCSTLAFGIGAKLGPKCKCCCFCSPFLSDGKLATGAIRDGHLVWDSCWCQCCHICCDAEKAVAEKIVNRQPNPAPFICVEPGSSGPLTFAEYDAKVIQEGSNPPFSGKFRANDGARCVILWFLVSHFVFDHHLFDFDIDLKPGTNKNGYASIWAAITAQETWYMIPTQAFTERAGIEVLSGIITHKQLLQCTQPNDLHTMVLEREEK